MKNKLLVILALFTQLAFGQVKHGISKVSSGVPKRSWTRVEQINKPALFVSYLIMNDKTDVDSIVLVREATRKNELFSKSLAKGKGNYSGIVIRIKSDKIIVSIDEIIKSYKILGKDMKLPVVVDDRYMNYPDDVYAVKSSISYVRVENHWYTKQPVIYIRTTNKLPDRGPY